MKSWMIPLAGLALALAITAAACGELTTPEPGSTTGPTLTPSGLSPGDAPTSEPTGELTTPETRSTTGPTPTPGGLSPGDSPTSEPPEKLARECALTVEGFPGPIDALRGVDRIPTGFDPVNSAGCTFTKPIASVSLALLREGETIIEQEIILVPPSKAVAFPLPKDRVMVLPDNMEPGSYDRRIQVTSTDGDSMVPIYDTVWVFDPAGHPVTAARHALAERLGVEPDVTHIQTYEPVTWSDTALGCPEPGRMYAQVETPGFKLVFIINTPELWGPMYEYHTNLDGSMLVLCKQPGEEDTVAESPIEFVMEDHYPLGQAIEIKIRNVGTTGYVHSEYYPACVNLEFYNNSGERRPFEEVSPDGGSYVVELPPGLIIIPKGTHCDIANESLVKPGEEVVLLTWSQNECVKDRWGCLESVPVKPGKYTIIGKFSEAKDPSDPNAAGYEKGEETVAEWSFTIGQASLDYGYESLLEDLRAAGASVEELTGPLTQYGFSVGGRRVAVNEGTIHVFEFPGVAAAGTEASFVSTDGGSISVPLEGGVIRETLFEWVGTPHFYMKGTLIVVYIGDDTAVMDVLEAALGPQFSPYIGDTVEVAAPIIDVGIEIMESFPPQYALSVLSGLTNSCVSFSGYTVERDGNTIRVELTNSKNADPELICAQVYGTVGTRIPLGSDFEPGETYTVVVNDVTETFVAQ